jgi:hypothetical protein
MTKAGDVPEQISVSIDRRCASSKITRRECFKLAASAGAMALTHASVRGFPLSVAVPTAAGKATTPPEWTGKNRKLGEYFLEHGYPAYEPHPRYIG